jgi:hypothetical protein
MKSPITQSHLQGGLFILWLLLLTLIISNHAEAQRWDHKFVRKTFQLPRAHKKIKITVGDQVIVQLNKSDSKIRGAVTALGDSSLVILSEGSVKRDTFLMKSISRLKVTEKSSLRIYVIKIFLKDKTEISGLLNRLAETEIELLSGKKDSEILKTISVSEIVEIHLQKEKSIFERS